MGENAVYRLGVGYTSGYKLHNRANCSPEAVCRSAGGILGQRLADIENLAGCNTGEQMKD